MSRLLSKAKTKTAVGRRGFLKGAAAGAAALVANPSAVEAQQQAAAEAPRNGGARPNATTLAADSGRAFVGPPERIVENPGSDYMVDVIKSLGIEYCAANPGSTFDGLHESLINHGKNTTPEFLTCCHEESSVAMAHGYAKIEGKPMMALIHGTVGLQHASMAIYNAYADRVPIYMVVGNHADSAARGAGVQSYHSANDMGALVRDFTKWDDQPVSLGAFGDAAVRAWKVAMTPPMGPVLVVASHETQTEPNREPGLRVPRLVMTSPPAADEEAVGEMAKMLVAAQSPLIVSERTVRTPDGRKLLTQLAELLQAPVNSNERMEIGNRHPLAGNGGSGYQQDVTLCLEVADTAATARANRARGARTIAISSVDLFHKSNIQDFGHYASDLDLDVGADAEATLPLLVEACQKLITADRKRTLQDRGAKIAAAHRTERRQAIEQGSAGWDASPVSLSRLCAELWPLIEKDDWSLVSWQGFISSWPGKLWNFDKHYQYIGGQGAGGIGYNAPASVGAALANRKYGRLSINIQCDGDLNYAPGVLWTAAHHKIPLLTIMHNNRGYHAEVMILERMASERNRGQDQCHIGTKLWEPNINYAKMAETYGLYGEGPISDPNDLAPALKRGLERVKKGEPALIDVVTQPR
jgi:thiamine pyrophosphate-dependent acetolactate synthase large subunit-like protein